MNAIAKTAATIALAALAALPAATLSQADTVELTKPTAGANMFFADKYATAYYTVDGDNFRTVVTIGPGRDGEGNPMRFINNLSDGETASISIGGYGENAILVTLELKRIGEVVKANVVTESIAQGS